jgi:hypothetical protein
MVCSIDFVETNGILKFIFQNFLIVCKWAIWIWIQPPSVRLKETLRQRISVLFRHSDKHSSKLLVNFIWLTSAFNINRSERNVKAYSPVQFFTAKCHRAYFVLQRKTHYWHKISSRMCTWNNWLNRKYENWVMFFPGEIKITDGLI